jgi:DNA-directed RNA polymerase III subunit RPC1
MNTDGIVGAKTTTNHVADMRVYLGIEAARQSIINEIQYTMREHAMAVDPRHIMLLGDVMTYRGEIDGINRVGVAKIKDSILHKASFERYLIGYSRLMLGRWIIYLMLLCLEK